MQMYTVERDGEHVGPQEGDERLEQGEHQTEDEPQRADGMPASLLVASMTQYCANARQDATSKCPEIMLANRRMVSDAGRISTSSHSWIGASRMYTTTALAGKHSSRM